MDEKRKERLLALGGETLAEALLELAERSKAADDLVERLIATPKENIKRFKAKLSALKRSRRFIRWGESSDFSAELAALLQGLKSSVDDPCAGADLVAAFFEIDRATFDRCDDSSGYVGDVFRYDAGVLFADYALRCEDKKRLGDLVFKLNRKDDYGVRDTLIDRAAEYLPEPNIRNMIDRFQDAADEETDEYRKHHWFRAIESLARQIKDAPLFEKTRLASWGGESTAACTDIARVYLESGDAKTALSWIERIASGETFKAEERDRLLLDIYERLGDTGKQAETAWRIFRTHRSADALAALLDVIGQDQEDAVIKGETATIMAEEQLSLGNAGFLIDAGRPDQAAAYLFDRREQLDGAAYVSVLSMAEAMEKEDRPLIATLLYRALLESVLERAQTRAYAHGAEARQTRDIHLPLARSRRP